MLDLQLLGAAVEYKPEQMSEEELKLFFLELRRSKLLELKVLEDYLIKKCWINRRRVKH